jgi:hypothetical protein
MMVGRRWLVLVTWYCSASPAGRRQYDGWKEVVSNGYLVLDEIVQHLQQEEG